jgi:PAS domain S-box-containing protein
MNVLLGEKNESAGCSRAISDAYYKTIFEITSEGVIIIDTDSRILAVNDAGCAIFGYKPEDLIGKPFSILLQPEHRQFHDKMVLGSSIDTPRIVNRNRALKGQRKSGEVFPVEVNVAPLDSGTDRHYVGIFRDISTRVHAERTSLRRQKMEALGHMTGGLAHEFNNLLGIVLGNLDLLSDEITAPDAREMLRTIERSATRAADLTNNLLNFARPTAISEEVIQLNNVIDHLRDTFPKARPSINTHLDLSDDLWLCRINQEDFESALLALLTNAYDAMPAGGNVDIETDNVVIHEEKHAEQAIIPIGEYVRFRVRDTGMGILDDIREKVFEPFFSTKADVKAIGLGLSNVFGFVKRSNGYVALESLAGVGTAVSIYLPRSLDQEVEIATPGNTPASVAVTGARILIVDDEPELAEYADSILQKAGLWTKVVTDVKQAMDELAPGNDPYDILLTDIMMHGDSSGVDIASFAKKNHPEIRVIAVSGFFRDTPAAISGKGIIDLVMWKPYRREELLQALSKEG